MDAVVNLKATTGELDLLRRSLDSYVATQTQLAEDTVLGHAVRHAAKAEVTQATTLLKQLGTGRVAQ